MIVTINTDASFHPLHKIGAYAFWIVCDRGKIMHSGVLKKVKDSLEAEVMCIANALYCLKMTDWAGVTRIIINSDCMNAFSRISGKTKAGSPERLARNVLKDLRRKYNRVGVVIHEFRHVKAHSGTKEARKWVNDWCDKSAKRMLWQEINRSKEKVA